MRALSKLGLCSRTEAAKMITAGRVSVDGRVITNPLFPTCLPDATIVVDGQPVLAAVPTYLALNKPRGLVTTTRDERGRVTVFDCLKDSSLPSVHPVGRLDKASEGLLLLTNDTTWASGIIDPRNHVEKVYHVQIDAVPNDRLLDQICKGIKSDGDVLMAKSVTLLRCGEKNSWLEITLDEGKNRHIRRMLAAMELQVLRLIRIQIGNLCLGKLNKGHWRYLNRGEVSSLTF